MIQRFSFDRPNLFFLIDLFAAFLLIVFWDAKSYFCDFMITIYLKIRVTNTRRRLFSMMSCVTCSDNLLVHNSFAGCCTHVHPVRFLEFAPKSGLFWNPAFDQKNQSLRKWSFQTKCKYAWSCLQHFYFLIKVAQDCHHH